MKCPFCQEEILDDAIKCKHCGSALDSQEKKELSLSDYSQLPWYRKEWSVVALLLIFWPASVIIMWSGDVYYKQRGKIKKRGKIGKLLLTIIAIVATISFFQGEGEGLNISFVKNGILEFDKSLTVGEAFDNYKYFETVTWDAFVTENGREVVEAVGRVNLDKHPNGKNWRSEGLISVDVLFQFLLNRDGDTFEVYAYGLNFKGKDGTEKTIDADDMGLSEIELMMNLGEIYNNKPLS